MDYYQKYLKYKKKYLELKQTLYGYGEENKLPFKIKSIDLITNENGNLDGKLGKFGIVKTSDGDKNLIGFSKDCEIYEKIFSRGKLYIKPSNPCSITIQDNDNIYNLLYSKGKWIKI
jgi:hypothetical protein